jgi:hypothetical protein
MIDINETAVRLARSANMSGESPREALQTASDLRQRAMRYRAIAERMIDARTIEALLNLANEYDEAAQRLEDLQQG